MARVERTITARTLGVAFLAICVGFVWFTYAVFTKKFADYDLVTLKASNAGLQLPARADVKIRGVIVGEVQEANVRTGGVDLVLGLYPSLTDTIPSNVTAEILPKTLFGEKYISLVVPESPARPIRAGDTIARSQVAIEVEKVLSDIYPLLRTVQPEQLNYTLTAMANALEGRGEQIGESLETLDAYLARFNPELPALIEDVKLLGQVSETYSSVVPELAQFLRNTVVTGNTFLSQEAKIQALFNDVASFSSTTRDFLQANGQNIIRLGELGQQTLPLLARYAPQFPCEFKAMRAAIPREAGVLRGREVHIILETLPRQPRAYRPDEAPVFGESPGPFPHCGLLDKGIAGGFGQKNLPPVSLARPMNDGIRPPIRKRVAPGYDATSGFAGTASEKALVAAIGVAAHGGSVDDVPDIATVLFGPLARGMQVSVR